MEARALLDWYDRQARSLPWRAPPGLPPKPAYHVWLSEVMLQQTTVAAVIPYFEAFTRRWPTVQDLAAASDADVMAAWAGLGYYARARNLVACAREVTARGGEFPESEQELRALPGLGAYTAAAIAAIAFGKRAVVVDANVERVVSRLFAIAEPLPAARGAIRAATDTITPDHRAGDFAQAMMDLGSGICTVRAPKCLLCPLSERCQAHQQGLEVAYPVKAPKRAKPQRTGTAFWIECQGHVWLVQRPAQGMLGGMRALPDDGWTASIDGHGIAPLNVDWAKAGSVSHTFTHFSLQLSVRSYMLENRTDLYNADGEWWPIKGLADAGLPTLFAKAAQRAMSIKNDLQEDV